MPSWGWLIVAVAFCIGWVGAEIQLSHYCTKLEGRCFQRKLQVEKLEKENRRLRTQLSVITEDVVP